MPVRLALILSLLILSSCTKVPDELPGWVQDRIRFCRSPGKDCDRLEILEYGFHAERYYYFAPRDLQGEDELFTANYELLCKGTDLFIDEPPCSDIVLDSLKILRLVYSER
ncbi:MAG: hypothetical protein IPK99_06400 [Flavobacteriales bacterium]|nr:hypothetical protein [Flavobacteriales bacterium]